MIETWILNILSTFIFSSIFIISSLINCANKPPPTAPAAPGKHVPVQKSTAGHSAGTKKTADALKPSSTLTTSGEKPEKIVAKTPGAKTFGQDKHTTQNEDDGDYENITQTDENNVSNGRGPLVNIVKTPGGNYMSSDPVKA